MQDSPEMVAWILLVLCNFPVYLFLAWVLFDSAENASTTFFEALVRVLKIIFIPRYIRIFMDEDDAAGSEFMVAGFLIACIAATFGEAYLLNKVFTELFPMPEGWS
jgi:hypothetical protein